jgi:hypothetical protein
MTGDTGKIRNPARAFQHIDYTGIRYGNATPSNIDGILELQGRLFVLFEYKHVSAQPMPKGQRMMIERIVDNLQSDNVFSIAIVGVHDSPIGEEINASVARAIEIRWKSQWIDLSHSSYTVKSCVDRAYHYAFQSEEPPF